MLTQTFEVQDIQTRLKELLALVREGTEIILVEDTIPLARIVPAESSKSARVAGLHAGQIWASDDFDEPLPDEFWTGGV